MDSPNLLRDLLDNWLLVSMLTGFLCIIFWLCFPARKKGSIEAANIPFRDDTTSVTTDPKGAHHG
ncbi:MAG: cbb3-type cytochrome c oxidase subunit 3 [Pseudomonadota bacterium]